MTKDIIEEYLDIQAEIKDLEQRIKKRNSERVTDTVRASSPDYPYLERQIPIRGRPPADDSLQQKRLALQKKLKELEIAIEEFVESLPRSRERRVVRYRAFDGLSWSEIAAKMGHRYTKEGVRKIYERAIKKFF